MRDTGHEEASGLFATDARPCGTIVRTGHGWLEAAAAGGPHVVRMELCDSAPPEDNAEWQDAVEIPYRNSPGVVDLTYVTGAPGEEHLRLR